MIMLFLQRLAYVTVRNNFRYEFVREVPLFGVKTAQAGGVDERVEILGDFGVAVV